MDRRGLALIVASAVSSGGVAVLSRLALSAGMGVADLQFWRWGVAAAVLAPLVLRAARPSLRVAAPAFALTAREPPLRVAALLMLGATASFGLFSAATGTLAPPPSPQVWAGVLLLGVVCTAFSVGTFYLALPLIGAARAALVSTLEPVSTIAVAYVVLGEWFTPLQFLGGALILGAVALLASEVPAAAEAPGAAA